ncbi:FliM/FliN family flagellar motor C-terminal domain-containing protein [Dyella sp.]|uniref:FliM/FliN family flagellar motor switch protein n=1 Tax=Dyella sp. TaxID=1869338 RepID=UPI002FD94C33
MSEPRRWRPVSAADLRTIDQAVMRAVEAWLEEWVSEPCATSVHLRPIDQTTRAEPSKHDSAWSLGAFVRLAVQPIGWDALLRRVLALPAGVTLAEERFPSSLLDPVRDDLQGDLLHRLVDALALQPALPMPLLQAYTSEQQAQEKLQLTCLLDEQQPLFDLRMAEPWRWLATPVAQGSKAASPLERRQHALAGTRLKLTALLGRCELSLAELGSLSVGDVITTSQALSMPLDVAVLTGDSRPGRVFALGQPGLTQGKASVQITSIHETSP